MYRAHCAVIFAIAQLSCTYLLTYDMRSVADIGENVRLEIIFLNVFFSFKVRTCR